MTQIFHMSHPMCNTVKLQIQVVEKAPFKVLLGCPFLAMFGCDKYNIPEGSHKLGIVDLKTSWTIRIPSVPRIHKVPHHNQQVGKFCR